MSTRFALRLDVQPGWNQRVSDWASANANGFIFAYEVAGESNHHLHAILDSVLSIKRLRSSLTRAFPECVGNKGYSLKACDDNYDAYIRYICKGEDSSIPPTIWCKQGLLYTAQHIEEAHAKYWVNNESLKENAAKRVKVEKTSIIDQVEALAKAKGLKGHDRVELSRIYLRLFRDARKGINLFAARAVVNTVSLLLDGDCAEDLLAHKIADV
jgi:hypothetical protein